MNLEDQASVDYLRAGLLHILIIHPLRLLLQLRRLRFLII